MMHNDMFQTILLQTPRTGVKYCVACSELDSDADKDNPGIAFMQGVLMKSFITLTNS